MDGASWGLRKPSEVSSPSPPTTAQGVTLCSRPSSGETRNRHSGQASPLPDVCTGCRSGGVSRGSPSSLAPGVPPRTRRGTRARACTCPRRAHGRNFSSKPTELPKDRLLPGATRRPAGRSSPSVAPGPTPAAAPSPVSQSDIRPAHSTVPSRVALPSQRPRSLSDGEARGQPADKQAQSVP